jgi:hypothetical protein
MKAWIVFALLLANAAFVPAVYAKDKKKMTSEEAMLAERKEQEAEKQKELENSEWPVKLVSQDPKAKGPSEDVLTFRDGKVSLASFEAKGYAPTSYNITPREKQSATWETVQRNSDGGYLSIRGDWHEDRMTGVVSESLKEGKEVYTYDFTTQAKKALKAEAKKDEAPVEEPRSKALVSREAVPVKEDRKDD